MANAVKTQGTEIFYLSAPTVMTKIPGATGVSGLGGARPTISATDLDSTSEEYIPGLEAPGAVTVPFNFDPANTVHRGLLALWQSGAQVPTTWVIGLSDGVAPPTAVGSVVTYPTTRSWRNFSGYISDLNVDKAINSKYEATLTIQRTGPIGANWKTP